MKDKLLNISRKHPLSIIILTALVVRIIAMIFSKGYGFENEHFFYVETPNAWLDNIDNTGYDSPRGISLFYVSINYLIFGFFKLFGIHNPQWLMFFSRIIHGLISLTIITLGYRITKIISDKKCAVNVAWLLALLWFTPYVNVHNIAQNVAVPFLLYGTLLIAKQEKLRNELKHSNLHRSSFIIAGIFFGIAFSVWYQSILFYAGILVALILLKNWKGSLMSLLGFVIAICVTQTLPDLVVWGRPFVELREFLGKSSEYLFNYDAHAPWIYYSFLTVLVALIPPLSFALMFGFFKACRKQFLLFFPTFIFLLFYTIFPNYDELYILPVVPIFIIIGMTGWHDFRKKSSFWLKHSRLEKYMLALGCSINAILIVTTMFMYSNKPEVKAMTYLSKNEAVDFFVIDDETTNETKRPPLFYEKHWSNYIIVNQNNSNDITIFDRDADYVIFRETENLDNRVEKMRVCYPNLKHEVTYKPYFAQILYKWLNNSKDDGCVAIYKVDNEY